MTSLQGLQSLKDIPRTPTRRPKIGFLGLGWIGLHRMNSLAQANLVDIAAIADPDPNAVTRAEQSLCDAVRASSLDELLTHDLNGIVIATPSAMHAQQVQTAVREGLAVFCQKPLARTESETRATIELAQSQNCLLGVDFSYRHVAGLAKARQIIADGSLGEIFMVDLTFHNAYGPDKPWFYDMKQSGGGCVIDLGSHLIDLCLWMLRDNCETHHPFADVRRSLWRLGTRYTSQSEGVEDAAVIQWRVGKDTEVRLTCSWNLHAGTDAVIQAKFYGTQGAIELQNQNGSFYDLAVHRNDGIKRTSLAPPDNNWGGRALVQWANKLTRGNQFDPEVSTLIDVARLIDEVYHG